MITTTEEKDNTAPLLYTGLPKSISIFKCDGKGYGIFTNVDIEKRRTILKIQGSIVKKTAVQNLNAALQIDDDLFMESRGTFDEYVNHSCSPNCCCLQHSPFPQKNAALIKQFDPVVEKVAPVVKTTAPVVKKIAPVIQKVVLQSRNLLP